VVITMRTTQKKMMSKPVMSTDEGQNVLSSGVSLGHPNVEWHHSADENHVSSTSSSCLSALTGLPDLFAASSGLRATKMLPSVSYHAGMRWPHQSWRDMHQSWTLASQLLYQAVQCSGTNLIRTVFRGSSTSGRFALTAARQISWKDFPGKNGWFSGAGLVIATNH